MQPKTFVLVKFNKHKFSFMAAMLCYFMVQKSYFPIKAFFIVLQKSKTVALKQSDEK